MAETKKKYAIGVDIGGSHIATAVVDIQNRKVIPETKIHVPLDSGQNAGSILEIWVRTIKESVQRAGNLPVWGIGFSIPGPADYQQGILKIKGCNKYESLFGIDIKTLLATKLKDCLIDPDNIVFINDASGFLLGEVWSEGLEDDNIVAITLGTGIGSGFMQNGSIVSDAENIPEYGEIYNLPYRARTAEDWISTQWFLSRYEEIFKAGVQNVKQIAEAAAYDERAQFIFEEFGMNLGSLLFPVLEKFDADLLILGGNITKGYSLFKDTFEKAFNDAPPKIHFARETENAAILGAVKNLIIMDETNVKRRETEQILMPVRQSEKVQEGYNIFPSFEIEKGVIVQGFDTLAREISKYKKVCIEGYVGVDWDFFIGNLSKALHALEVENIACSVFSAYKNESEIEEMISPFLGGDDPVFGRLFEGELESFIDVDKLSSIKADDNCLSIIYGPGASLGNWDAKLIYIDIPKNEIQYRSRAGWVTNLGVQNPISPKPQYKRMFFVDWPVLNKHKKDLLKDIDYIIDGQYLNDISWCSGDIFRLSLNQMSKNAFRARPWFEPGVWGGDWIKKNIAGLSQDVVNYAWSFELIVPENGIVFSYKGVNLEVSFDFLMFNDNKAILGDAAKTFGTDFPIRFDFLDTFNGDKLSLQCHPSPNFITEQFGERFTQDETYYILDAEPDAKVYLGFHENIDEDEFHRALNKSHNDCTPMDVESFVQIHPAKKHDLFLIPHGTVHCSGENNLVLEISSTPYIYTFKMYDWMRMDLNGHPRPLNIERGMANLNFDCKGDVVKEEYISKQTVVEENEDSKVIRLSTHPQHFYEVYRMEFKNRIHVTGNNQCHVLSLVEGNSIEVITGDRKMIVKYAETFVIPAEAGSYRINNLGPGMAKVVKSYVKPEVCNHEF